MTDQQNTSIGRAPYCSRGPSRWLPGAVLIIIGTLILLDHMDVINGSRIWRFWPVLLIIVGIAKVVNEGKRVGGVMLILVGAFFTAEHLGYRPFTWDTLWPVLIILAGVAMIWGRFDRQMMSSSVAGAETDKLEAFALFGGIERRIHTSNFVGGQITATFGGVEIDFRSADIAGEEAQMYLDAVFGGIELVIPERWTVVWDGQNIFGGYSDETRPPLPDVPGAPPKKRLVLRGRALFGGISVKN